MRPAPAIGIALVLLSSWRFGADGRVAADASSDVVVRAELADGVQSVCEMPPEQVRVVITVPGRRAVSVLLDESGCGFGGEPPHRGALVDVSCFCAGAGAALWVTRAGSELRVHQQAISEDGSGPEEIVARVRLPRGAAVRVDEIDSRSPSD